MSIAHVLTFNRALALSMYQLSEDIRDRLEAGLIGRKKSMARPSVVIEIYYHEQIVQIIHTPPPKTNHIPDRPSTLLLPRLFSTERMLVFSTTTVYAALSMSAFARLTIGGAVIMGSFEAVRADPTVVVIPGKLESFLRESSTLPEGLSSDGACVKRIDLVVGVRCVFEWTVDSKSSESEPLESRPGIMIVA